MAERKCGEIRRGLIRALPALLLCCVLFAGCAGTNAVPEAPAPTPAPTRAPASVRIGGKPVGFDREYLTLSVDGVDEDLPDKLALLPRLRSVRFLGGVPDEALRDELTERFPGVRFRWDLELLGKVFPNEAAELSFAGQPMTEEDLAEIAAAVSRFPKLERVDLTDCGLDGETLHAFDEAIGDVDAVWTFPVYGVSVCSTDREADFSDCPVRDGGAEIEAVLPWFSHLEKVVMCRCGLSDEAMDALDKRHEDVRFVWEVRFSIFSLRTDATNFIASRFYNKAEIWSDQLEVLKYCPDLIALDLGHRKLVSLDFLYYLPKLQYLVLVENDIQDITPIGSLSELKYLELFWTKVEDISPLINCTRLTDLNISYIYCHGDETYAVLTQMPWLERVWACGNGMSQEQVASLREQMPQCEFYVVWRGEATGGGWRDHPHYFEMRDAFEMYYMPGGTNGVAPDGSQIIIPDGTY